MHGARDVTVYLHCGSRPIIEDCSAVRFAPLPESMVPEDVRGQENLWDRVDDFGWLRAEKSPNWRVLEEGERGGMGAAGGEGV